MKKERIKPQLAADIYIFKLDKRSRMKVHKRFVVCGSLSGSESKLAGYLDITLVLRWFVDTLFLMGKLNIVPLQLKQRCKKFSLSFHN